MSVRTIVPCVIAWATACVNLNASASRVDEVTLRTDVDRLLGGEAASLFTPNERATLRARVSHRGQLEEIDHILANRAPIEVTINPEARVSVRRTGATLPKFHCGTPTPILIRVVNQAFVTSNLGVRLRDMSPTTLVNFQPIQPRLAGASLEYRVLLISLTQPRYADITLRFDAGAATEDLGNRSTTSVLVRCDST
jgi:hypothetical protein